MSLLEAFDVSSWQGDDLGNLSRYRLGIPRASYGLTNAESRYPTHITQIVKAGLVSGAYHAGTDTSGAAQADYFLKQLAAVAVQPRALFIDTREFGMSVSECNAFIARCKAVDPLKRPVLVYDSEGNWQGGYIGHDGDWVANYGGLPRRPFAIWQDASHGGPAGGDHDQVEAQWLDKLGIGRAAPLWKAGPLNNEVNLDAGKVIYRLDGRTRYSATTAPVTFKAPGQAPGWTMVLDGSVYAAVQNKDLAAIT
jgi:hypothetical protein